MEVDETYTVLGPSPPFSLITARRSLKNLQVLLGQQEVVPRPAFGRDERLTLTREAKVGVVLCGVHVPEEPLRRLIPRADLEAELEASLALAPVALDEVVDALLEDALELLDDALRAVLDERGLLDVERVAPVARVDGHGDGAALEADDVDAARPLLVRVRARVRLTRLGLGLGLG